VNLTKAVSKNYFIYKSPSSVESNCQICVCVYTRMGKEKNKHAKRKEGLNLMCICAKTHMFQPGYLIR